MTNRTITVTTTAVDAVGKNIEQDYAVDYQKAYIDMFDKMQNLNGTWNGTDFSEFSTRALSFRDDFDKMYAALIEYGRYLQKAAKAYESTQEAVLNEAKGKLRK